MKERKFAITVGLICMLVVLTGGAAMAYYAGFLGSGAETGADESGDPGASDGSDGSGASGDSDASSYVNQNGNAGIFAKFESGYDEELGGVPEKETEYETSPLNLLLSSVDHDIKMLILDESGQLVTGQAFYTVVEGPEESFECEDFDRDGIIYASDLVSGDYGVTLYNENQVQSGETVHVRVREEISYTPLVNIKAEVYNEQDIDAANEDTAEHEEVGLESEPFDAQKINLAGGSIGVDVSKYNKDINWEDVKASGIDFAIIRIGYRGSSSGVLVVDPYFMKNLAGARAAGMKIGVYFFTQAINVTEAVEEASAVTSLVAADELELPVFMDVESSGGRADSLENGTRTEIINAFCRTLENSGYKAGVYANKRWYESKINKGDLGGWKIWLARYRSQEPGMECDCWQYTSRGSVDGIVGNVDLDVNYGL